VRRWRREAGEVYAGDLECAVAGGGWMWPVRLTMVGLVCVCMVGFGGVAAAAAACSNAVSRVGRSAGLPDCRAYELVTPADLGRMQDMTFTEDDHAVPSSDGEQLALEAGGTPLEPGPDVEGSADVFSRTAEGWVMTSATAPGASADHLRMELFSPDLSQVALVSYTALNEVEESESALEVGPVGGPYTPVAKIPDGDVREFLGANAGAAGAPAFSDVLFSSNDHELLPPGPERTVAEGTVTGTSDLYDWSDGRLRLVNVTSGGSLASPCGAQLGEGLNSEAPGAVGAVSADGSKVFFTSPEPGSACQEPSRLYMRVDGIRTVEVSAPQGVSIEPSERRRVIYNGATPDDSEVFFNTSTPLTAAAKASPGHDLYEYNTVTDALTLIASDVPTENSGEDRKVVVSEDGSTVYYERENGAGGVEIYRYEVATGRTSEVARAHIPLGEDERSYTTPNGEYLLFASVGPAGGDGVEGEPRGAGGHNEWYRYDNATESVMCVSCGVGAAPANGEMVEPGLKIAQPLEPQDEVPDRPVPMSEDGQEVFFQSSARLVPQDKNDAFDVYEWEADGAGGCEVSVGCTYLLSSGEDVGPSLFLGASKNGEDVFFSSASQLAPEATPEFTNIYDARVDGGFPLPVGETVCSSCRGAGSVPPLSSVPASGSFEGAGNPFSIPGRSASKSKAKAKAQRRKSKKRRPRRKAAGRVRKRMKR
jgi:hypothetical protein